VFVRRVCVSQSDIEVDIAPGSVLVTVRVTVGTRRTPQRALAKAAHATSHPVAWTCL
jgi:hypothetical protein